MNLVMLSVLYRREIYIHIYLSLLMKLVDFKMGICVMGSLDWIL